MVFNINCIVSFVACRNRFLGRGHGRSALLDFAKGVAIFLVVVGHTLQGQTERFDELFGFRFIYSFHMPLFAFLAGASATFWISKIDFSESILNLLKVVFSRIWKSVVGLLIPFVFWTVFGYLISNNQEPFVLFMKRVFNQPDYSLWFLPCMFWCVTFCALFFFSITLLLKCLKRLRFDRLYFFFGLFPIQIFLILWIWKRLVPMLPAEGGLAFANSFHGGLFRFFMLGILLYNVFVNAKSWWVRSGLYFVFFYLVQFWHRTMPNNILEDAPGFLLEAHVVKYYGFFVAITGTLVFIDISRIFNSNVAGWFSIALCYIGASSIAIYAIHFYFVGYNPPIIAAIGISLAVYWIVSQIPILRSVTFGK